MQLKLEITRLRGEREDRDASGGSREAQMIALFFIPEKWGYLDFPGWLAGCGCWPTDRG